MGSGGEEPLLDAAAMRQLESLSLAGVEAVVSGFGGQRPGAGRSRGLEFVDYRRYTPGDDLRGIDWNVYARLREVVVKASPSEGHVDLALLLDGSRSMASGTPPKFRYAQQLGAMLGTVALLGADVVTVHLLADGESWTAARLTAPHLVGELVEEVATLPRGRRTDLTASLRAYRRQSPDVDLAVLITDGFAEPADLEAALPELAGGAHASALVHLVDSAEAETPLRGPVELRDIESGERLVVEVTPATRRAYNERFEAAAADLRRLCEASGVTYLRAATEVPALDLLFDVARGGELVTA
ncbi:MAG: DUF58 domain-containing protein [Actinobacteria bacterium]|nr:DUF58 domain-containing protein [Actinomycetota bacterium]